uniref:BCL2/adenovirus E1B interacting protein 3 n=1 Tax=Homo sapiens TaxID=9606 RepID=A0A2U8ZU93_HUMAN|nr:BCL2/adenovirus E1B interacting protein 3 [Homo sapiens]
MSQNGAPGMQEESLQAHLARRHHKIPTELLKQIPIALERKTAHSLRKMILKEGKKLKAS